MGYSTTRVDLSTDEGVLVYIQAVLRKWADRQEERAWESARWRQCRPDDEELQEICAVRAAAEMLDEPIGVLRNASAGRARFGKPPKWVVHLAALGRATLTMTDEENEAEARALYRRWRHMRGNGEAADIDPELMLARIDAVRWRREHEAHWRALFGERA
jgi:hypothetical protein